MVKAKMIQFKENKNGCFICTSHHISVDGYAKFTRNNKKHLVHRYVYEELFGEIPDGLVVRHKCDVGSCINPEHLELGTQFENVQDRVVRDRGVKGERVKISVLDNEKVKEIKEKLKTLNCSEISKMYNVHKGTIRDIKIGKTWKHVI